MEIPSEKGKEWIEGMTGIIIQARLGSTRLPRKVLLPIDGKSIIRHVIDRCLETGFPVVLAVPDIDQPIFYDTVLNLCPIWGGHPTDVLDRYYEVAKTFKFDPIVRITGDCPLVDPNMIKEMVKEFENSNKHYFSNCHPIRTVPSGMDIEVMSEFGLTYTHSLARKNSHREHVTSFLYEELPSSCGTYSPPFPDSWKMSIDTQEDYERVKAMIEEGKFPWRN